MKFFQRSHNNIRHTWLIIWIKSQWPEWVENDQMIPHWDAIVFDFILFKLFKVIKSNFMKSIWEFFCSLSKKSRIWVWRTYNKFIAGSFIFPMMVKERWLHSDNLLEHILTKFTPCSLLDSFLQIIKSGSLLSDF